MELIPPLLLRRKTALFPRFYRGKGKTKGQSIIEYALVIGVVVAALVGTQAYIKRGLQGRLREAADSLGQQYEPKNTITNSPSVMTFNSTSTTVAETLSEKNLSTKYGYTIDLDGDNTTEDDVFGTVSTVILGDWTDINGNGIPETGEISGGTTTAQKGSETVGKL